MRGIRVRILLAVLTPLLLLAFTLGAYFITVRVDDARTGLEQQGQNLARYLAVASEFNLLIGNRQDLQVFSDTQVSVNHLLVAVAFFDKRDRLLGISGAPRELEFMSQCRQKTSCSPFENRYYLEMPVYASGVPIEANPEFDPGSEGAAEREFLGRLVLLVDTQPLTLLQRELVVRGLFITMAAVLVTSVLALLFAKGFSGPIARLSQVVSQIQAGNMSARTEPAGSGEVLELEQGVNAMAAQVQQANENLQQKVEQSTKDLLTTLAELKINNQDLEEARQRAEDAGRVKDLFLARMSHELRTPLISVIGYLNLLEDTDDASERKAYGKIIDQASGILLAAIDDILDFIRLDDGDVRLETTQFNLQDCLANVVALQAQEAQKKHLKLECLLDDSVPKSVVGDSARLAQVITNLLSNAIKFTQEGHVRLSASAQPLGDGGSIELTVSVEDTGIGVDKKRQADLFQPFVQAEDSTARRYGGSGLGLSISRRLVEAMQGNIKMAGDLGEGLVVTFRVVLGTEQHSEPALRYTQEDNLSKRILLVEDNDLNRQLLRIQLEAEGAQVYCADGGEPALSLARQELDLDMVLMDVHMPGMDGIELAPKLAESLPNTPIYAITANVTGSEEALLLNAGVGAILYKPLNEKSLKALMTGSHENVLEVSRSSGGRIYPAQKDTVTVPEWVVPKGMQAGEVLTEFYALLEQINSAYDMKDWVLMSDAAHKLLGSSRLFTRGPLSNWVLKLEDAIREQRTYDIEASCQLVEKTLSQLSESVTSSR